MISSAFYIISPKFQMTIFVIRKYQQDESNSRADPTVQITRGVGSAHLLGHVRSWGVE